MYLFLLITHFIGLAMGVGTGFAAMALGRASQDLAPPERMQFMLRASAIRINGSVGLLLLLLSGLGMLFYRGVRETLAWGGGAFHAKLTLFVVLIGVFGYMQVLQKKARVEQSASALAKIPKIAGVMLILNVSIVVTAVLAFK
jgi:uncharacterized membrane protein